MSSVLGAVRAEAHAGVFYAHWTTGGGLQIGGARELRVPAGNLADFFEVVRLVIAGKHAENTTYRLERTAGGGLRLHRALELRDPLEPYRALLNVIQLDVSDFLEVVTQMMPAPTPKEPSP